MADTIIEADVPPNLHHKLGLWGPYWIDPDTAVVVYIDSSLDLRFTRTTNGGANWANTLIKAGAVPNLACWFDKENTGDAGSLIHVAWLDNVLGEAFYRTVDVSDGSLGTERSVDSGLTISSGGYNNSLAITQTVNDNLLVTFATNTEEACYRSVDSGANWTSRTDMFENTPYDWVLLYPAATGDGADACALFWDASSNRISLKMYDDSADSWTETEIASSVIESNRYWNMDGAIRHSDSHLLMAFHSRGDNATDDLRTFDLTVDNISSPTITAKTDLFTDVAESAQCAVFINQQNDDVYISWLYGLNFALIVDVVFKKSTDGMGAWGAEQAYSEEADDYRIVHAGRTVGSAGGRYQPVYYDDDDTNLQINLVLDIAIAEAATAGAVSMSGVGSMAAAGSLTLPGAVAFSGVGTMVVAGTKGTTKSGQVALSGVGTMSVDGVITASGEAAMSGVGSMAAVGRRIFIGAAAMSGIGSMSAIGEVAGLLEGRATISGVGSMTVVAERIVGGAASFSGVGSVTAVAATTLVGQVAMSGVGSMDVIGETGDVLYTIFGGVLRSIDPADYPDGAQFFLEVTLDAGSGTARARLYNITDAAEVSDSALSTASPTPVRLRSSALTLASGANSYRVEYGGAVDGTYTIYAADLLVESD